MKKIKLLLVIIIAVTLIKPSFAGNPPDEGMWIPMLVERLNYVDMQKAGLKLTAEELYSINHSSLKDAIVQFGGGCTGEIISNQGLLMTNHHCGFESIQQNSTVEHDYLTNGFWAYSKAEELPNPELTVTFMVRMEDVTSKVLAEVTNNMTEGDRLAKIKAVSSKLKKAASEKGKYTVEIKSFFEGNEYYMFVYEVYKDVRLVGAPPSSVGKFGGDTDNWMWPRHTGDFSMFRVYCAPDGSPREYNKENVPLTPKHYLPINIKGVKKDDFAMIWGYPGKTDRYVTSYGITELVEHQAPTIVKLRGEKQEIMKEFMDKSDAVRIQYASKYAQSANYWKYFIGQTKGLKNLDVYGKKKELENQFDAWVKADPERVKKYGNVLKDIETSTKSSMDKQLQKRLWFFQEMVTGAELTLFAYKLGGIVGVLKKEKIDSKDLDPYRNIAAAFYKDYYMPLDRKVFAKMISLYNSGLDEKYRPAIIAELTTKYKGNFEKMANDIYKTTVLSTAESFNKFLDKPKLKTWENDPMVKIWNSLMKDYMLLQTEMNGGDDNLDKAKRLFIAGLREMNPTKKYAADANSTMRMTYGKVMDYSPKDGVTYDYYTTEQGIIEKADSTNDEFVVPKKLLDLLKAKDFGRYGKDGHLPVCFIANTDITGGNSGSPTINAEGHYIGSAFDGNWEAMSGDIAFEPALQRTIVVDARYILFIIEKYAGAKNLINEMKIIE
jgi:hypothetical protein